MMLMKRFWTYLSLVILVCSCGLEEETYVNEGTGTIEFMASRMRIITKAGDKAEPFAEGTDFRLFAVQSGTSWDEGNVKFYNCSNLKMEGILMRDSAIWCVNLFHCFEEIRCNLCDFMKCFNRNISS